MIQEIKDHWMDNIDWVKIKETGSGEKRSLEEDDDKPEEVDILDSYKQMLEFMKPGETVLKGGLFYL